MAQDKMDVKYFKTSEIIPYEKNPRINKKAVSGVVKSIKEFGFQQPIVVDKDMVVIVGHTRLLAAKELKLKEVPVLIATNLTKAQVKAYRLADNKTGEIATWDLELIGVEIQELIELDFDIELTGFDTSDFDQVTDTKQGEGEPPEILKSACLDDLAPTDEELKCLTGRKVIVEFSGGKDSSAASLWVQRFLPDAEVELCFCDMGADYVGFELFLREFSEATGLQLKILRSTDGMVDHMFSKGEWPHFMHPYCHNILHATSDAYIKQHTTEKVVVVRGGRKQERCDKTAGSGYKGRFATYKNKPGYNFFQPLYFAGKDTAENIITETAAPLWEGYKYGLQRTACRICPGQKPIAYAAIRANYPDVWDEINHMEQRFGAFCWGRHTDGRHWSFEEMAEHGQEKFEAGHFTTKY